LDNVAEKLLELHEYALKAIVSAKTIYYVTLEWNKIRGEEPVDVLITVTRSRDLSKKWRVQVEVKGMSVCPSAMMTISKLTNLPWGLAPSHSQKVIVRGAITTRGKFIRIEDIARALFRSVSAPTFTRLKRDEEADLILSAFKNPKFVEDIARDAMCNLYRLLKKKGINEAFIEVEVESLESIHPHNVYASRSAYLAEIENEIFSSCRDIE
jgi:GTP cyclohydrolase-4